MSDEQPRPKPGEYWRWTIEGKVVGVDVIGAVFLEGSWVDVKHGTWTRLPDPEPEYVVGDWYLSATGAPFRWAGDAWWSPKHGHHVAHDHPRRPLVRLVPEKAPDA